VLVPPGGRETGSLEMTFDTALTCYLVLGKADNAVDEVGANDVRYTVRYR
jgi:hypothetical protein